MPTRNPRVNESFVQVFLNGQLVGTFGPYQTMRAALADAKTLAISRRDNRAANGGIDAMVHTYKDAQGQDLGYSVVARKKDAELPHLFEAYGFVSANRPAAQSGRAYTQQAQQERVVRFNGKKKPAKASPRLGGVSAIYHGRIAGRNLAVDAAGGEYRLDPEDVRTAQLRVGDTIVVRAVPGQFATFRRSVAKPTHANPQVEFTAHGKPVSFFARKTKGK